MRMVFKKEDILENLKMIPPLSVGVEIFKAGFLARMISVYYPIWLKYIKKEKITFFDRLKAVINLIKKENINYCSHMFVYLGQGNHSVIETSFVSVPYILFSLPHGVVKITDLKSKIIPEINFWIFKNNKLTVEGLQKAKEFIYNEILGKFYDLEAFISFVTFSDSQNPKAYICTEASVEIVRKADLKFMNNYPSFKIHPEQAKEYLESKEGKKDGWERIMDWDGKYAIFYDNKIKCFGTKYQN